VSRRPSGVVSCSWRPNLSSEVGRLMVTPVARAGLEPAGNRPCLAGRPGRQHPHRLRRCRRDRLRPDTAAPGDFGAVAAVTDVCSAMVVLAATILRRCRPVPGSVSENRSSWSSSIWSSRAVSPGTASRRRPRPESGRGRCGSVGGQGRRLRPSPFPARSAASRGPRRHPDRPRVSDGQTPALLGGRSRPPAVPRRPGGRNRPLRVHAEGKRTNRSYSCGGRMVRDPASRTAG
jgi:hypothetical protein